MKEIREYLTELEKINNDIINLKFYQAKTYQTLIDRIMLNCRTEIHPDVLIHLNKTKRINKIGYWVHDIKKKLFMGTRELLQFMGKDTKRESFSEEEFFSMIHKDDVQRIFASYSQDVLAHEDRSSAYRIITPQSDLKYVLSHFSTKYDDQDKPIQVTGVIFEIPQTEAEAIQPSLVEKNEVISANMGVGFWEYDPQSDSEYWSSSLYDIIETTPKDCPPNISSLRQLIMKESLAKSLDAITHGNNKNSDYEITIKIKTLAGNEKILFSQVHHLVDQSGKLVKRYGLIYDLTKIKQLLL